MTLYASRGPPWSGRRRTPSRPSAVRVIASRLPGPLLTRMWDHGLVHAPGGFDVVHAVSLAVPPVPTARPGAGVSRSSPSTTWRGGTVPRTTRAGVGGGTRPPSAGRCVRPRISSCPPTPWPRDLLEAGAPEAGGLGDPARLRHPAATATMPAPRHCSRASGCRGEFLLSVGTLEPRKNLPRLFEAYGSPGAPCPGRGHWWWSDRPGGARSSSTGRASCSPAGSMTAPWRRCTHGRGCSPTCRSKRGSGSPRSRPCATARPWWRAPCPPPVAPPSRWTPPASTTSPGPWCRSPPTTGCGRGWPTAGRTRAGSLTWESAARAHVALWSSLSVSRALRAARSLVDVSAVPAQPVGAGRYTIDLVTALVARDDVALTLWSRRGDDGARWGALARRRSTPRWCGPSAPERRPARLVWEQVRLPSLLAAASVDVHHGPHYTMPEHSRVPTGGHDPRPHLPRPSRMARAEQGRRVPPGDPRGGAPRRRHRVCEPTHRASASASCVPRRAGCSWCPTASTTTGSGPSAGAGGPTEPTWRPTTRSLRRLGVRPPYVLFVGTLEPRKAVPDLVAAFDRRGRDAGRAVPRPGRAARLGRRGGRAGHRRGARSADRVVPHRLRPRRRRAGAAAPGRGGRLPRPRGGLRAARPRGPGVRHAAGHHGGHGHGRGLGRRRCPGDAGVGARARRRPGRGPRRRAPTVDDVGDWAWRWRPVTPGRRAPRSTWPPTGGRRDARVLRHRARRAGPR